MTHEKSGPAARREAITPDLSPTEPDFTVRHAALAGLVGLALTGGTVYASAPAETQASISADFRTGLGEVGDGLSDLVKDVFSQFSDYSDGPTRTPNKALPSTDTGHLQTASYHTGSEQSATTVPIDTQATTFTVEGNFAVGIAPAK